MNEGAETLSIKTIDGHLPRTKRKGRGRSLETIPLEADQKDETKPHATQR